MKRTCVHYRGHLTPCEAGHDIRALVGGPEDGWLCRMPCITGTFVHRPDEAVTCPDFFAEPAIDDGPRKRAWEQMRNK